MIINLRLENWKAYERLDLALDGGTTFVVAENGVGKTSLLQGAAFALFGSGPDPTRFVRAGSKTASAAVDVLLPDGRVLQVKRRIEPRRQVTDALVDGAVLAPEALGSVLGVAFGVPVEYLARLTLLSTETSALHNDEPFQLHQHLAEATGVADLVRAADLARTAHEEVVKERKRLRQAGSGGGDLSRLEFEAEEARARAAEARDEVTAQRSEVLAAQQLLEGAERRQRGLARHAEHEARVAEAAQQASTLLGERIAPADLAGRLEDVAAGLRSQAQDTLRSRGLLAGRQEAVESAMAEVLAATAICPVCRRPLSGDEAEQAAAGHRAHLAALTAQTESLAGREEHLAERLQAVETLLAQARPLGEPLPEPGPDLAEATQVLSEVQMRAAELNGVLAEARRRAELLASEADEARASQQATKQAVRVFRREAVAQAAAAVLTRSAERALAERIDPLAAEVAARWKRVFVNRGALRLNADGTIALERNGQTIAFEDLSSGEKVVSLLATRLLVLSSLTRAGFLWLDEPLEHLDPKNRRIVAGLLARATEGGLSQVLVTTYEEPLARRLADQVPGVDLRYVRPSDE